MSAAPVGPASRRDGSVRATLRRAELWWGLGCAALIALSAFIPGVRPRLALDERVVPAALGAVTEQLGRAGLVVGMIGLTLAWWRLRPQRVRGVELRWVTAIWAVPLALTLPVLSTDPFLYLDQGWQVLTGLNPYHVGLSAAGGPWADTVAPQWQGTTAVYPPGALLGSAAVVWLGHGSVYGTLLATRLPGIAAMIVGGLLLPRIARLVGRDPRTALWLGLANPIGVVNTVGGAHHDGAMLGWLLLAAWLALRWRHGWLAGAVAVGVAALVKQQGIVIFPAVALAGLTTGWFVVRALRSWALLAGRLAVTLAIVGATFAAGTAASGLGYGWLAGLTVPGSVWTITPVSGLTALLGLAVGVPAARTIATTAGLAVGGALLVWATLRTATRDVLRYACWAFVIVVLTGPSLWMWYLVPIFAFAGLAGLGRRGRFWLGGTVFAAMAVQTVVEYLDFGPWGAALVAAAVLGLWWVVRPAQRPTSPVS